MKGETYLGVTFDELEDKSVNMILPMEFGWCWLGGEVRRSTIDKPIALNTEFGWALAGGKRNEASLLSSCYKVSVQQDDEDIKEDVKQLFRKEFPEILENKVHESEDDKIAMKQMEDTIYFDEEIGHYRVGLPWKTSRKEVVEKMNGINSSGTSLACLKRSIKKIKDNNSK